MSTAGPTVDPSRSRRTTERSLASLIASDPALERELRQSLTPETEKLLPWRWDFLARPSQQLPPGNWKYWLIKAGRGFGKSRTGAETVREWVKRFPLVNLAGATADDARDIMIEGESGILAICPRWERPVYKRSDRQLLWPNGAKSLIFTADEPERLRGKQHMKIWCDELAAWRYAEAWDQILMGLRLPPNPQAVITTTPRPTKLIKELMADPETILTEGTSHDNEENLDPSWYRKIIRKYEGTRLGRQELYAQILDDNPNALWRREDIERTRVAKHPDLTRVVVAIDPAVTDEEGSAETGIVVGGVDDSGSYYVLEDRSLRASPRGWALAAVSAFHTFRADRIIGERNNGGDMIEALLRTVDPEVPYKSVVATRGKAVRAEPIASLYERGIVHHVGTFPALEDQMVEWDPSMEGPSPDRMDALVWALTELSERREFLWESF